MKNGRPRSLHKRLVWNFNPWKFAVPMISNSAFHAANSAGADSIYVVSSRQTVLNIKRIVQFVMTNRIPLAGGWGAWAKEGGLFCTDRTPSRWPLARLTTSIRYSKGQIQLILLLSNLQSLN